VNTIEFPVLDPASIGQTRDALHAYARILGDCLKGLRTKRKHWWHASLRPTLNGLSTGVVYGNCDFELELNFRDGVLDGRTDTGAGFSAKLEGQAASDLGTGVAAFLIENGIDENLLPFADPQQASSITYPDYSAHQAAVMGSALTGVTQLMVRLRAQVREECSPIQVWPHHFDLSMLWLPGDKILGQDPVDEEGADKQMNFGFTFGDDGTSEPYFYVTAYPMPDDMHRVPLPAGASWRTEGFNGAFLTYADLLKTADPANDLLSLWSGLLAAGRQRMMA
jgi:hypothetical protein